MAIDRGVKGTRQAIEDPFRAAGDVDGAVPIAAVVAAEAGDLQARIRVQRGLGPGLVHCRDGVAREGVGRVRLEEPIFLEPALRVATRGVWFGDAVVAVAVTGEGRAVIYVDDRGAQVMVVGAVDGGGDLVVERVEHGVHGGAEFLRDVGAVLGLGFPEVEAHVVALRGFVVPKAGVAGHVEFEAGVVGLVEDGEDGGVEFRGKVVLDLVRGVLELIIASRARSKLEDAVVEYVKEADVVPADCQCCYIDVAGNFGDLCGFHVVRFSSRAGYPVEGSTTRRGSIQDDVHNLRIAFCIS